MYELCRFMSELITMSEIRAMLKIGRTAGYELINRSDFPAPISISSKCLRWVGSEVESWINSQKGSPRRPVRRPKYKKGVFVVNGVTFRERA